MSINQLLFVGTAGRAYAIERQSGRIVWKRELNTKLWKMGSNFVNLEFDGVFLFATGFGELYCLDPLTGETRWKTRLDGILANPITFAASPSANREAALAQVRSDMAG